jgi:hypothetical protein
MRLLKLPVTAVRVPIELGVGAAKGAARFAQGLLGGGEETPAEKPRPAPPPRRRRTSTRSGNGRARSRTATKRTTRRPAEEAMKAAPPLDEPASTAAAASSTVAPVAGEGTAAAAPEPTAEPVPAAEEAPAADPIAEPAISAPSSAAEPVHVGEEPELVVEAAESGAEDGAGAEVAVDEPWPGYDEMTASDIEDRLVTEGPETAAAVSLYEASRKGRASVIEAASRTMTA